MKMPPDWMGEQVQTMFTDLTSNRPAPMVMWGCVGSLLRGEEVRASVVEAEVAPGSTRWAILTVTASRLVSVTASKSVEGWSAFSGLNGGQAEDFDAETFSAWTVPLSSVRRIEVVDAQVRPMRSFGEAERSWAWTSRSRVVLEGDKAIDVPLFGAVGSNAHEAQVERFLDALTACMSS